MSHKLQQSRASRFDAAQELKSIVHSKNTHRAPLFILWRRQEEVIAAQLSGACTGLVDSFSQAATSRSGNTSTSKYWRRRGIHKRSLSRRTPTIAKKNCIQTF